MGKAEKQKGYSFEVKVAKRICEHFNITEWQRYLPRTRIGNVYHSNVQKGGQVMGDLYPTHDMITHTGWKFPIECKNRKGWSLTAMMRNFSTSKPYYWFKDCQEEISPELWPFIMVFTQNNAPIFVMHIMGMPLTPPTSYAQFFIDDTIYYVELLDTFLVSNFPDPTETMISEESGDDEPVVIVPAPHKPHKIRTPICQL